MRPTGPSEGEQSLFVIVNDLARIIHRIAPEAFRDLLVEARLDFQDQSTRGLLKGSAPRDPEALTVARNRRDFYERISAAG